MEDNRLRAQKEYVNDQLHMQMEIKDGMRETKQYLERTGDQENIDVARQTYIAEEVAIR
tara:strand:+ start:327 stop:503 length:177 start_codon:yes stop_codon:yes gene_type:complete